VAILRLVDRKEFYDIKPVCSEHIFGLAGLLGRQLHFKRKVRQEGLAIEIKKECAADRWLSKYEKKLASTS